MDSQNEFSLIEKVNDYKYRIKKGFVPNMRVEGVFYVNEFLKKLLFDELITSRAHENEHVGFICGMKQIANVASLPGIVNCSIGLPDIHSGYGFAIGNIAAFDTSDPESIVSPGGVGFDINCGVRLIRTNLLESDIIAQKEQLCQNLFDAIPVGVGAKGDMKVTLKNLDAVLNTGMKWAVENNIAWAEDVLFVEEGGCMPNADSSCVSQRAKSRGVPQLGTLGAGNHYCEVQVVEEIFDEKAAEILGLNKIGQVCVMIHSGSRGLGHQVATDTLKDMDILNNQNRRKLNDRQLSCAPINSELGQKYLKAMSAAANFAFVNRATMTFLVRKVFAELFKKAAKELNMDLVYDVSHNIAKFEKHLVGGVEKTLLVHRKGATRAFPPHHELIPEKYKSIGQPVIIGGTMGTSSYVLLGTETGYSETFGTTCHGAGRALSRVKSRKTLNPDVVFDRLKSKNISIRVATPNLVTEEAPESYKNVDDVVETCHNAGISKMCVKLRPVAVIKG